jgi:hypothetical protein
VKRSSRKDLEIQSISPPEKNFYSKRLDYHGIPIKSASEVSDQALLEAWKRLDMMLCNEPNIAANLCSAGAQLHIIGKKQSTSDLPEHHHLKGSLVDSMDFDARTRGLGGVLASCGEENLLRLKIDRYRGRDICVHEFAHTILRYGLCETTREAVINQYKWSIHNGLWPGCYAATNFDEFFAESATWYFGTEGDPGQIDPPPERGVEWLRDYDLGTFALIDDIFSGRANVQAVEWQYLTVVSAAKENYLASERSDTQTQIRIVNESPEPLKIYWLDFRGERNFHSQIDPGDSFSQNTYTTHPWLITDLEECGIAIYIASDLPGIATIE